jgi:hypothetical protein
VIVALASDPVIDRLDAIAADLGRLRRRFDSNSAAWTRTFIVDRLAEHVETLDCMLHVSAGELVQQGLAVDAALEAVDARSARLRRLLAIGDAGW